MVERFNGRIADVLKTHRFSGSEDLEQTLLRYVALYNHQLPQSPLAMNRQLSASTQPLKNQAEAALFLQAGTRH